MYTAKEKAELLCKCVLSEPLMRGDLRVVVVHGPRMVGDVLEVVLEATRSGKPLALDNPFRFVNPPISGPESHLSTLCTIIMDTVQDVARKL